jgi:prevent-host-death family protein
MPRNFSIQQARSHLFRLVDEAARGDEFIIAKAGRPLVRVVALAAPHAGDGRRNLGGLAGLARIPLDIKTPFAAAIDAQFNGPR